LYAAYLRHGRMVGEAPEPGLEARAHVVAHALDQSLALDHVEVRERRGARRGMSGVRESVRQVSTGLERLGDLVAHQRGAERQVAARDALGRRHQVRVELPELRREPRAQASE